MCHLETRMLDQAALDELARPEGLALLKQLTGLGVFDNFPEQEVRHWFARQPGHPAESQVLAERCAERSSGVRAKLAALAAMTALALVATSLTDGAMSLMLIVLWGMVGAVAALVLKAYPGMARRLKKRLN